MKEWEDPQNAVPAARYKGSIYSTGDRHTDVTSLIWSQASDDEKAEIEAGDVIEFGWLTSDGGFVTIDEAAR